MIQRLNELFEKAGTPAIRLEYGGPGSVTPESHCQISDCGMQFSSNWRFEPGTEMAVTCDHSCCLSFCAEGIVVECEPLDQRHYRTTLFFLEKQNPPDHKSSGLYFEAAPGSVQREDGKVRKAD